MLFEAIFLALFLATWGVLGGLGWVWLSVRRRAVGAIFALPAALLGAMGGGAATPLLGLDDGLGIGVSMVTAAAGGLTLCRLAYAVWDLLELGQVFRPLARRGRCADRDRSVPSQEQGRAAPRGERD